MAVNVSSRLSGRQCLASFKGSVRLVVNLCVVVCAICYIALVIFLKRFLRLIVVISW